jgi:HTH-type transcriptional repressor of NAD biosynthesis genes
VTRGLVVGKFAPLHRGHELVIRRALAECDEVVIISWANPELHGCEPERRERWLAELFPEARRLVIGEGFAPRPPHDSEPDDVQRRYAARVLRDALGVEVDAVYTSEDYGPGFAAVLAEVFQREVRHVAVDPARAAVPVSGTAIRADVHAHRRYLDPVVYASFVERVVLFGGESSGKSTLAVALAEHFNTRFVGEYGRDLWEEKDGQLVFEDMLHIGERQIELEERAARGANRRLFCDTSPLTTLFYSRAMFGRADPRLEVLAERRYDRVVLCAPDFDFVQDGTRQEPGFRDRQHAWYVAELERRGIPWVDATGSVAERVRCVAAALA